LENESKFSPAHLRSIRRKFSHDPFAHLGKLQLEFQHWHGDLPPWPDEVPTGGNPQLPSEGEGIPEIPPEIGTMANEYLRTLQMRAQQGEPGALEELKKAIAHCQSQVQSTQRLASDLRADGTDVKYRKDGGIEFDV